MSNRQTSQSILEVQEVCNAREMRSTETEAAELERTLLCIAIAVASDKRGVRHVGGLFETS